ncbi:hypothetical protein FHS59_003384 [Algoriphagus iocasae]|uniref:Uncharacterized protein n=1 Tax=Algoriphagus iocasae TaxID=1836499 RepID=A0A841N0K2_9BACT|nr:hypothetical protein [Algoriphagus iocasae]MBB6327741.1 hypothetical protein [Algoriphagus iocasae]
MKFQERREVIEFLNDFEKGNPTEDWVFEGFKVWPILKTSLFLRLFWGIKESNNSKRLGLTYSIKKAVKRLILSFEIKNVKLKPSDYLFFSGVNFREKFKGESFNKFYDPIADILVKSSEEFVFFEYGNEIKEKTYQDRGINIQKIYNYFESKIKEKPIDFSKWKGVEGFISFFENKLSNPSFSVRAEMFETLIKVLIWKASFEWILTRTKPRKIFLLSYYNIPCFGLLIAARNKGIECVDIQHGTQGSFHSAYSGFKSDYSILPSIFWLWDKKTESHLLENLKFKNVKTLIGGNPWHYFLENEKIELKLKRPTILFTLQPLSPILDEYILDSIIKTKDKYDWLLRLHPRIDSESKEQLVSLLGSLNIFDSTLWNVANETPLPFLLKEVDLHISKFSGCISEAADLGTFSIILEEIGETTYSHLIEEGIAVGDIDFNVDNLLSAIQLNIGKKKLTETVDLEIVIDQIC